MPAENTEQRKLAAIMFTDMVGYSALAQRDEALALALLKEHHRMLRPIFPKFNGREIKSTGDGFLVEFASALTAAQCAIEMQRALAQYNATVSPERRFYVRIGVHLGDVVLREADIFGDGVNIAARIEPLAEAGGICLSGPVVDQIANKIDTPLVKLGTPELKNIAVPMEVYRVVLPWAKGPAIPSKVWNQSRHRRRMPLAAALALALLVIGGGLWVAFYKLGTARGKEPASRTSSSTAAIPSAITSLAVLPFDNFSGDTNKTYFADGLTDELIGKLAQIGGLNKVVSRTTVMPYRGTKKPIPEIGKELNVDALVEGSVVLSGARVSIKVQLIEAASDKHLWSNTYDGELTDIVRLQNDVTLAIAHAIRVVLTPEERTRLSKARPVNAEAYESYLLGKILNSSLIEADNLKAIESLERAIKLDKDFAPAYAALASAYIDRLYYHAPAEFQTWEVKASLRVQQALEIDPSSAEAHAARAYLNWSPARNFRHEEAVTDLQLAARLNPNLAETYYLLGLILGHTGFLDDSLVALQKALALDPSATIPLGDEASVYLWKGDFPSALSLLSKIPRGMGGKFFVGSHYAWTLFELQKTNEAAAVLEEFRQQFPTDDTGELAAMNAVLLAAAGDEAGAEFEIRKATSKETRYGEFHHSAYFIASAYARLRKPREALEFLKKAAATGFPNYSLFERDPNLNNLRDNAEFREFLREQEKDWKRRKETWLKTAAKNSR